jgi:hypothetical protein
MHNPVLSSGVSVVLALFDKVLDGRLMQDTIEEKSEYLLFTETNLNAGGTLAFSGEKCGPGTTATLLPPGLQLRSTA